MVIAGDAIDFGSLSNLDVIESISRLDKIDNIITTGDTSPGAVWENTSAEFKKIFNHADVIISKGQGNYVGLSESTGNIYFLFITKCDLIATNLGVQPGYFILKQNKNQH